MAITTAEIQDAQELLSPVIEMTVEESWAFFDDKVRSLIGISGEEFHLRLNSGRYDDILDDGDHSALLYLSLFLPRNC